MDNPRLEQLLHAYRRGHEQLAASIRLPPRDAELVTRLSDLSGTQPTSDEFEPYLTVYPLSESPFYAVAKTWPDINAPRAGCVITHTLLVPTSTWQRLKRPDLVENLFRPLSQEAIKDYQKAITLDSTQMTVSKHMAVNPTLLEATTLFVARFFGDGIRPVVWYSDGRDVRVLWNILASLWPHLRVRFSACTYALQPRSSEHGSFDLMFAPPTVFQRFAKFPTEHLIDGTSDRAAATPIDVEPWCREWAERILQGSAYPRDAPADLWDAMEGDPTAVRRLFLFRELLNRSSEPMAAVGAIDIVESLSREPKGAQSTKMLAVTRAIRAIEAHDAPDNGTDASARWIRMIAERLERRAFDEIRPLLLPTLSQVVRDQTIRDPHLVLEQFGPLLSKGESEYSGISQGVLEGFQALSTSKSDRLIALRDFPEIVVGLLDRVPDVAAAYLITQGKSNRLQAGRDISRWIALSSDDGLRLKLIVTLFAAVDAEVDRALFSDLLKWVVSAKDAALLDAIASNDTIVSSSSVRPELSGWLGNADPGTLRQWAMSRSNWSEFRGRVFAAAFPLNRVGLEKLLINEESLSHEQRALVVALYLERLGDGGFPKWLVEFAQGDVALVAAMVAGCHLDEPVVRSQLQRVLRDIPGLPFWQNMEMFSSPGRCGQSSVRQLLTGAVFSSAISGYVSGVLTLDGLAQATSSTYCHEWLSGTSSWELSRLIERSAGETNESWVRAWTWASSAPDAIYARTDDALPRVISALLDSRRASWPDGVTDAWLRVLERARANRELRLRLCGQALAFALAHNKLPIGRVAAEAFGDVYFAFTANDSRGGALSSLFGLFEWDKGKELRQRLIDAFISSDWAPADLALAAPDAELFRKLFKRLYRSGSGRRYAEQMARDLRTRSGDRAAERRGALKTMLKNPDFFEEWD